MSGSAPNPNGHLQATGRDARGRKQSRYHPRWREVRDETKYERMTALRPGPPLNPRPRRPRPRPPRPPPRKSPRHHRPPPGDHPHPRRQRRVRPPNKSYGLTTMRNKHVDVDGSTVTFTFQGKSGVHHTIDLTDRRLARIVKRCEELPGYELFQYLDPDGTPHSIDSADVNEYLRDITGQHFTAKDFRTWAGSVLACVMLAEFEPFASPTASQKQRRPGHQSRRRTPRQHPLRLPQMLRPPRRPRDLPRRRSRPHRHPPPRKRARRRTRSPRPPPRRTGPPPPPPATPHPRQSQLIHLPPKNCHSTCVKKLSS